ncbi:SDR family oxidoreductase [Blastococcus mobilis]|uniref:NAD(P)-dependent dehydrogenase, short-chain alcohol dehydrogenase family n=1 Tax=Blastococcus mobilis TaxID=1938746 RepID=A0A239AM40_9ACTN|nr:SDR family oxidoreductase [Blastococcus mobilis]SNR96124.1 NAD(P)-dependent dehydrogenase, short-chain alcohol dehydrogenase family [Blastococcus mobilis]
MPPASYAMEDLAVWLARFLDAVGIAAATVGGNSIDGLIAIHLALGQPRRVGCVDILMNNASVDASGTYVADLEIADFERALRSNLIGQLICCKHFINHRKQQGGGGKIINTTSVHQEQPRAGAADYDCSKGALRNLTRTLVLEVSELGMTVNNIAPGMVLTPFNQAAIDDPDLLEKEVQSIPLKRAAQREEIGRLAVFLASSDADYVTGATYVMDGGLMQMSGQGA